MQRLVCVMHSYRLAAITVKIELWLYYIIFCSFLCTLKTLVYL